MASLEDYLQMIEEAESTGAQVRFYMGKVRLREELPELAEDIEAATRSPLRLFGECFGPNPRGPHTYFGCGHNTSIVHCDPSENLLVVISGTKTLDLYPPYEADCLYPPVRKVLTSPVPPLTRPDAMPAAVEARYPLYRHARPLRVELSPGEMLYLPAFWWHGVSGGARRNMILNFWCEMHPAKLDPQLPDQGACGVFRALERVPGPVGPGAAGGP